MDTINPIPLRFQYKLLSIRFRYVPQIRDTETKTL